MKDLNIRPETVTADTSIGVSSWQVLAMIFLDLRSNARDYIGGSTTNQKASTQ